MATPLHKLLGELEFDYPCVFSLKELSALLDNKTTSLLKQAGILQESTATQSVFCPSCGNEHEVHYKGKEPYLVCPDGGYISINRSSLTNFKFDTPPFITLFLKALDIDQPNPTETIAGLLWDLGTHKINSNQYHLFFTRNIDDIDERSIITSVPNKAVFYLGTSHLTLTDDILFVPMLDIVKDLNSEGLVIDHKTLNSYFKAKTTSPSKRELRKKVNNIIKTGKFSTKEKAFLKCLAKDFESVTIEEVSKEVTTPTFNACSNLKGRVKRKLNGTDFDIKLDKGGWGRKATYQLVSLLSSEKSR